jgi:protein-S-isoprenylcysteine O-methyltransferase Ste14
MLPLYLIKAGIVFIGAVTLIAVGPWFVRWLRRQRAPIVTEPSGWFQWAPHLLMILHTAAVLLLLVDIDPLPFLHAYQHLANNQVPALAGPVGVVFFLIGNVVRVWGLYAQGNVMEKDVRIRENQPLITSGPYAVSRHPIYTGNLMAELGLGLAFAYWPLIVFTLLLSLPAWHYRTMREETMLVEHFGEDYRAYQTRVGRFLPW